VTFVKIDVQGVTPVDIAQQQERPGDFEFSNDRIGMSSSQFYESYVRDTRLAADGSHPLIRRTGTFAEFYRVGGDAKGIFYFNGTGSLTGIASPKYASLVLPSRYIWLSFQFILAHAERTGLGISYYYSSDADAAKKDGAIVFVSGKQALDPKSLAAQAGLKTDDRIVAINSETVNDNSSLEYLWQKNELKPQVILLIDRAGSEFPVTIIR